MRRKDTEITLKRGFSGMLSAAIVVSQLVSGGMTALAEGEVTTAAVGDKIIFEKGATITGEGVNLVAPYDEEVEVTEITDNLPSYLVAFGQSAVPAGYSFTWVSGTGESAISYDPEADSYENVVTTGEEAPRTATLTGTLTPDTFTVTLDTAEKTKTYDTNLILADAEKVGYSFTGWTIGTSETLIDTASINAAIDAAHLSDGPDVTVNSNFTANTYTITYDANGGEGNIDDQEYVYAESGTVELNDGSDFTRTDYELIGWSEADDRDPEDFGDYSDDYEKGGAFPKNTAANTTLYAVWKITPDGIAKLRTAYAEEVAEDTNKAAEEADKAAAAAEKNPTAATVKAAKEAAKAATDAAADAKELAGIHTEFYESAAAAHLNDEVKADLKAAIEALEAAAKKATASAKKATDAATAAQKKIDDAKAAEKSDGSTKDTVAPKGNALKDAAGKETGFVVTNDDAKNPEVKYVGTEADKTAEDVKIDTAVDQNGHVYKVTEIAEGALQNATGKNLTIGKSVKKIGKNACKGAKFKKITIKTDKKGKVTIGKGAFKVKNKKCVIKVKGAKGKNKTKLIKKIKKQASKGVTVK